MHMSTENDNLQNADGVQNSSENPTEKAEKQNVETPQEGIQNVEAEKEVENVESPQAEVENVTVEKTETQSEQAAQESGEVVENQAEVSPEEKSAVQDFDETADKDQHHDDSKPDESHTQIRVPLKNYEAMSPKDMIAEGKKLLAEYPPVALRTAFGQLRDAFKKIQNQTENQEKEKFLAGGGNILDFNFDFPLRGEFNAMYADYRAKVESHYKAMEEEQQNNLKERLAIIDELKALYMEPSENNGQIFSKFRELKTRWHNAGRIPKADAGNVFKTYYHHLDNFNEFLDMNQELRKMDYEHNLEIRKSIINRAQALVNESNVQKALNELQYLHRMWKEEAVPVAEEHREPTWQEFKDLTAKIHDRKNELNEQIIKKLGENLVKKKEIIAKISNLLKETEIKSHNAWQRKIKEMNALRDAFFAAGRVPREENQKTWDEFKEASRLFNHEKNAFYKTLKNEQMANLEKKRELIKVALEHRDSSDWNESVKVVKRIQNEWKRIGHVPRKYSDKIWKEFSDANNTFFDRYKNRNNEKLEKQQKNLEAKLALIEEIKAADQPKEKEALLAWINEYSIKWSAIGFVPNGKQEVNKEFSKLSGKILLAAGLDKDAVEKAQWKAQLEQVKDTLDEKLLRNLKFDIRKAMDDVQKEVTHLQTNLAFFSNADDSNPLFKNAISNIENKVAELKALENKYDDLKHINIEALREAKEAAAQESAEADSNTEETEKTDEAE